MIQTGTLVCPLYLYIGATFNPTIQWSNGVLGAYVDLTGANAAMDIRPWVGSNDIIANLTTGNGGIIIANPTVGILQPFISAANTMLLSPVNAVFDLQITNSSQSEVDYLLQGEIIIQQMVTR